MKEQALILREQAKNQLLEIKSIDEAVNYINKEKAVESYCKATKEDNDIVKIVCEQKIRSMRLAGKMLTETQLHSLLNLKQFTESNEQQLSESISLEVLGITKNESSTFQKLASIPDDVFEEEMQKAKEGDSTKDITVSRFKRISQDNALSQKLSNEKILRIIFFVFSIIFNIAVQ